MFSVDIVCANILPTQHSVYSWTKKQFQQFSNRTPFNFKFHFYLQQDLKCYNKEAVEAVSLVEGWKGKGQRIGKKQKNGKRRREENGMSIIYRENVWWQKCLQRNSVDESYFFLIILRIINEVNKRWLPTQIYIEDMALVMIKNLFYKI